MWRGLLPSSCCLFSKCLIAFLSLISWIIIFSCIIIDFFLVKCLNFFTISLCVYSISFMVTMGITLNYLVIHYNLNLYQANFNNIQKLLSFTSSSRLLSAVDVIKLHLCILCAPKHKLLILLNALVSNNVESKIYSYKPKL